jgi:hypothetical protein
VSNDKIRGEKEKRGSSEGRFDKNGNVLKFGRDLESDWSVPCGIRNVLCIYS